MKPKPTFITICKKCGCCSIPMMGLYRCDHPDLSARRCGGVLILRRCHD